MKNATIAFDHDISIMPIFDLEKISYQAITYQRVDKIPHF